MRTDIIKRLLFAGVAVFFGVLILVFATGQTFGQGCAASGYGQGGQDFHDCLIRLSETGDL